MRQTVINPEQNKKKLPQIDSSNVHSNILKNKRPNRQKCRHKREENACVSS